VAGADEVGLERTERGDDRLIVPRRGAQRERRVVLDADDGQGRAGGGTDVRRIVVAAVATPATATTVTTAAMKGVRIMATAPWVPEVPATYRMLCNEVEQ